MSSSSVSSSSAPVPGESQTRSVLAAITLGFAIIFAFFGAKAQSYALFVFGLFTGVAVTFVALTRFSAGSGLVAAESLFADLVFPEAFCAAALPLNLSPLLAPGLSLLPQNLVVGTIPTTVTTKGELARILFSVLPGFLLAYVFYKLLAAAVFCLGAVVGVFFAQTMVIPLLTEQDWYKESGSQTQLDVFFYVIFGLCGARFLSRGVLDG
mmetsp:Transcript_23792/g.60115  ORF Transcript_23792/g.60115 Transcript_23792/m.60115 type:complete len:210 (-) Transcript_23792:556-1185(-)|eukprot:CAMPEP_0179000208 /NCGR_PEP_ID=MMETSP0795-20121207/10524_1 /TAXON_ID=88552 /ORGANISM="Amoebophrya sp., Strain Ameob2" /LENGTH=209 /DNA_ID=CAMNT_0020693139 /DNA_START=107 /DNA_END=736 /DNA_ORIENTATION=+